MPYRTELRRPDLKGTFRCSICNKIFCHSSSLSRHRMQAHFKSYTCTLCNKEITSNETLRAHMYKKHQISRMFMCRCCNWAFPDKTSLHIHMQAMATGSPGNVSIIAKSSTSPPPKTNQNSDGTSTSSNSIFPSMSSKEELINRLRERAMIGGGFPSTGGLDLSMFFPNFAARAVDGASGSPKDDDDAHVGSRDTDNEDEMMAEIEYGDDVDESWHGKHTIDSSESPSPKRRRSMDVHIKDEDEKPIESFQLKSQASSLSHLPTLLSAIGSGAGASPLNSLLYHKKLTNALRNKRLDQTLKSKFASTHYLNPDMQQAPVASVEPVRQPAPEPVRKYITQSRPTIKVESNDCPVSNHVSPTNSASSNSSGCCATATPPPATTPTMGDDDGGCSECRLVKGKLAQSENRCRFLESRTTSQESKISRLESRVSTLETNNRRYEIEAASLRDHCENLERKILECQERALKYLSNSNFDADTTKKILHDVLENCRVYKPAVC